MLLPEEVPPKSCTTSKQCDLQKFKCPKIIRLRTDPVGVVVKDIAIGTGCFGFDSRVGQMGSGMFIRSCVAQALSRNEPHHSLQASPKYSEYDEH